MSTHNRIMFCCEIRKIAMFMVHLFRAVGKAGSLVAMAIRNAFFCNPNTITVLSGSGITIR